MNEEGVNIEDKRAIIDTDPTTGSGGGQRGTIDLPTTQSPQFATTGVAPSGVGEATNVIQNPDDQPTKEREVGIPDWGAGSGNVPLPPGVIPPTTDEPEPAPDQPIEPADTRATIEKMLTDPTSVIADKDLEQTYTEQQIQEGEIQDPTRNQLGDIGDIDAQMIDLGDPVEASPAVQAGSMGAALIDPASLTKAVDEIAKIDPMQAASMSEHLDELLDGMEDGNVPLWARPAVAKVEQMLASRGISASSVGRDSLFNAIIQAAMPIAQQDAAFEQEAYKTNYQAKVNAVMSDVSMEFAAKQFNATSKNQASQFNAQMQTQVALQNASRMDAMKQFNAQMNQSGQQFNASQANAMTQMQVQLQSQREQFNSQMASQIEQSNVNWRRQVNQINTAGVNAVNQANVQNAFNLSNQALTFLWQEMRDEAHWEFQASEAEKDRKNQLEASILANETALGGEIGTTIENLINGGNFLRSFFSSWGT